MPLMTPWDSRLMIEAGDLFEADALREGRKLPPGWRTSFNRRFKAAASGGPGAPETENEAGEGRQEG